MTEGVENQDQKTDITFANMKNALDMTIISMQANMSNLIVATQNGATMQQASIQNGITISQTATANLVSDMAAKNLLLNKILAGLESESREVAEAVATQLIREKKSD